MRGVLTRANVLIHSLTIVRLLGVRAHGRCLRAAFGTAPTPLLAATFAYARPARVAAAERARTTNRSLAAYPGT
jgi:hypothetical protein